MRSTQAQTGPFSRIKRLRGTAAEKGYVLALTALLIMPLVGAVGLAVDLGAWYARASQIQRVTDAASLAGVIYLPDVSEATRVALNTVRDNGIPVQGNTSPASTADGQIQVVVRPNFGSTAQLVVEIHEADSAQYFSAIFVDDVSLERISTAEFIKPVAMGSPKNFLGTGQTYSGQDRENMVLAVSSVCASREQGDRLMTASDANWSTTGNPPTGWSGAPSFAGCAPGTPSHVAANPEYDPMGYFYAYDVPVGFTGTLDMQVFDAPMCGSGNGSGGPQGSAGDSWYGSFNNVAHTMIYTARDANSFDPRQATVLSETTVQPNRSGWCGNWRTVHSIANPTPGIYYLQVRAQAPTNLTTAQVGGSNSFSLRAGTNGSFSRCSSAPGLPAGSAPYSATCVQVHGTENMGVLARFTEQSPTFYLADLGPEHSGKILEITLWDMGEGTEALRILNPNNTAATFRWTILCANATEPSGGTCPGEVNPDDGRSGVTDELDTQGEGDQPGLNRASRSKYNDRFVRLQIQLPDNITAAYGGRTWWRVQYDVDSSPTDRTTWSVIVRGDPVRLVPN